jgi:hypothetical protein
MLNHPDLVAEKVLPSGLPQNSYPDVIQYTTVDDKISQAALQENIRLYFTFLASSSPSGGSKEHHYSCLYW